MVTLVGHDGVRSCARLGLGAELFDRLRDSAMSCCSRSISCLGLLAVVEVLAFERVEFGGGQLQRFELLAEPPHVVFKMAQPQLVLAELLGGLRADRVEFGLVLGNLFELARWAAAMLSLDSAARAAAAAVQRPAAATASSTARSFDERATLDQQHQQRPHRAQQHGDEGEELDGVQTFVVFGATHAAWLVDCVPVACASDDSRVGAYPMRAQSN